MISLSLLPPPRCAVSMPSCRQLWKKMNRYPRRHRFGLLTMRELSCFSNLSLIFTLSRSTAFTFSLYPTSAPLNIRTFMQDSNPCPETSALDQLGHLDFVVTFFQNRFKCLSVLVLRKPLNCSLQPHIF